MTRAGVSLVVALVGVGLVSGVVIRAQRGGASIVGVWRVTEVTTTGPDGRKNTSPQPGLRIYTQRHYSISEVGGDKPRAELPAQGATDKQIADAWGQFVGQSGTYEIKGNEVIYRAIAAKNPGAMRAGNMTTATFSIEGNTLTVTQKSNAAGPVANPTTTKLTRVE